MPQGNGSLCDRSHSQSVAACQETAGPTCSYLEDMPTSPRPTRDLTYPNNAVI